MKQKRHMHRQSSSQGSVQLTPLTSLGSFKLDGTLNNFEGASKAFSKKKTPSLGSSADSETGSFHDGFSNNNQSPTLPKVRKMISFEDSRSLSPSKSHSRPQLHYAGDDDTLKGLSRARSMGDSVASSLTSRPATAIPKLNLDLANGSWKTERRPFDRKWAKPPKKNVFNDKGEVALKLEDAFAAVTEWTVQSDYKSYVRTPRNIAADYPNFSRQSFGELNPVQNGAAIVDKWCQSYEKEEFGYESISIFAEMRLREILHDMQGQPMPNRVQAAVCADLLLKVSAMFGRYKSLMRLLTDQLLQCIYEDYADIKERSNNYESINAAFLYYKCMPFFDLVGGFSAQSLKAQETALILSTCIKGKRNQVGRLKETICTIIFLVWRDFCKRKRMMKSIINAELNICAKVFQSWKKFVTKRECLLMIFLTKKYFLKLKKVWSRNRHTRQARDKLMEAATKQIDSLGQGLDALLSSVSSTRSANNDFHKSVEGKANDSQTRLKVLVLRQMMMSQTAPKSGKNSPKRKAETRSQSCQTPKEWMEPQGKSREISYSSTPPARQSYLRCSSSVYDDELISAEVLRSGKKLVRSKSLKMKKVAPPSVPPSNFSKKDLRGVSKLSITSVSTAIPHIYVGKLSHTPQDAAPYLLDYMWKHFLLRFGVQTLAMKQYKQMFVSFRKYHDHPRVRLFCKLAGIKTDSNPDEHIDHSFVLYFYNALSILCNQDYQSIVTLMNTNEGKMPVSYLIKAFPLIYKELVKQEEHAAYSRLCDAYIKLVGKSPKDPRDTFELIAPEVDVDDALDLLTMEWDTELDLQRSGEQKVKCVVRVQKAMKKWVMRLKTKRQHMKYVPELYDAFLLENEREIVKGIINLPGFTRFIASLGHTVSPVFLTHLYLQFNTHLEKYANMPENQISMHDTDVARMGMAETLWRYGLVSVPEKKTSLT